MQTEIIVEFEQDVTREEVEETLQDIERSYPESELKIEEPEGAFPAPPADPFILVIAANSSVQLLACLYPKIKDKLSNISGDSELLHIEDVAIEYLETHTRVNKDRLDLTKKDANDNYIIFVYEFLDDGSEHRIEINPDDIRDWKYNEV